MLKFIETESIIHRLDARVKVLALLLFSSFLLIKFNLIVLIAVSLLILTIYILSNIPFNQIAIDFKLVFIFVTLPIIIHALVWRNEILLGMLNSLMLLNLFALTFIFIYTTKIRDITQALLFYKLPKKLVFSLIISFHFIPMIQDRFEKVRIAQIFRGHRLTKFLSSIPLLIPMLHFSFKKSRELALSLDSRGFDQEHIKVKSELKMKRIDYISLIFLFVFLLLTYNL